MHLAFLTILLCTGFASAYECHLCSTAVEGESCGDKFTHPDGELKTHLYKRDCEDMLGILAEGKVYNRCLKIRKKEKDDSITIVRTCGASVPGKEIETGCSDHSRQYHTKVCVCDREYCNSGVKLSISTNAVIFFLAGVAMLLLN